MAAGSPFQALAQAMCSLDLDDSNWILELPRLPVPDLGATVANYLSSLRAVLEPAAGSQQLSSGAPISGGRPTEDAEGGDQQEEEEEARRRRQFRRTSQLANQFLLDAGPQLQRDLKEHSNRCQNWATDFWLEDMYLSNPAPLPVNSNPFFLFPRQRFGSSREMLLFATRIIQFSVDFKCRIDRQTLRQDYGSGHAKGLPLCMETYRHFFHSYRMPHEDLDRLLPQSRRSNHIVVASCDQFYVLRLGQEPLADPYDESQAGQLASEASIFEQLMRIYLCSRERKRRSLANMEQLHPLGLLTSEHRKTWARLHKRLQRDPETGQLNQTNCDSLRQIEDCLFVMCLDSLVSEEEEKKSMVQQEEEEEEHAANVILTGAGSHLFTGNRWFDKFLQVIVGRDGTCGINIEHSASEGITVIRFLEEFFQFLEKHPIERAQTESQVVRLKTSASLTEATNDSHLSPDALLRDHADSITPLQWKLDAHLDQALEEARLHVDALIRNFALHILNFNHFGRGFIKSCRLSPDAFVQMALQYTFYRRHARLVSSYESGSLRQFRLGRVDNIRANTCEVYQWIQAMLRCREEAKGGAASVVDWSGARDSFKKAIEKQVEILRYTITGAGPDNHLLALRQLAKLRFDDDSLPDLFTDPSYAEFLNFRLSTSQLPNESGITVGYGAVVPDGYGCSYNPRHNSIVFCVSSFRDCPDTCPRLFASTLEQSLLEMQQLCSQCLEVV